LIGKPTFFSQKHQKPMQWISKVPQMNIKLLENHEMEANSYVGFLKYFWNFLEIHSPRKNWEFPLSSEFSYFSRFISNLGVKNRLK